MEDLTIIQLTYDFIQWYVPILNRLPRDHKFMLGNRIIAGLYDALETTIKAKYTSKKLPLLYTLNIQLEILRYQSRLLLDFGLIESDRYEHAGRQINAIGIKLGSWIKQQQTRKSR